MSTNPHNDLAPQSAMAQDLFQVYVTQKLEEAERTHRQLAAILISICNGLGLETPSIMNALSALAIPLSAAVSPLNSPAIAFSGLSLASQAGTSQGSSANSSMRSQQSGMFYFINMNRAKTAPQVGVDVRVAACQGGLGRVAGLLRVQQPSGVLRPLERSYVAVNSV